MGVYDREQCCNSGKKYFLCIIRLVHLPRRTSKLLNSLHSRLVACSGLAFEIAEAGAQKAACRGSAATCAALGGLAAYWQLVKPEALMHALDLLGT